MNELLLQYGVAGWKPFATALMLPPLPLLLAMLLGGLLLPRRPAAGWLLLLGGAAALWLGSTAAVGEWLQQRLLQPPPALSPDALSALRARRGAAIVVLGGGRVPYAPEIGASDLSALSLQRLRYGLWLARETGLPVAFSGGRGHADAPEASGASAASEAETAARIAEQEFGRPLKWTEPRSRDTRENAEASVALLRQDGVTRIVLVTHGWHMPRAQRAFEQAIAAGGGGIALTPAPLALAPDPSAPALRWLPSEAGFAATRRALREALGLWSGS